MGQAIAAFAGGAASAAMNPPQTPSNLDSLSTVSPENRESTCLWALRTYVLVIVFFPCLHIEHPRASNRTYRRCDTSDLEVAGWRVQESVCID